MLVSQDLAGQSLIWRQSSATKEEYALLIGEDPEPVARLRWPKAMGSLAEASAGEYAWTFKRVGFWRPNVTIRAAGSETDLATFDPRWNGDGDLAFASGVTYRWHGSHVWNRTYAWRDADERELVRFGPTKGFLKSNATVEPTLEAAGVQDLSLLVLFGWYLLVMGNRDVGGAGATGAIVATTATTT